MFIMPAFAKPLPVSLQKRKAPSRRHASIVALDRAILSIDVGTSATKAGLYYPDTRNLARVYRRPHKTEIRNGLALQRKQDWLDAAIATSRQAVCNDAELVGVSITGQMQDLIAVGDTPPLLTSDAILYSTNVPKHAARLSTRSNVSLLPSSIPAKLALLTPGNYRILLGAADFLTYALSEEQPVVTDATTVSTTSLTGPPHRCYNAELLKVTKQERFLPLFPEILTSPMQVGTMSEAISRLIHRRLSGVPVFHAGGDAFSATIGADGDYVYGGTSGWVGRTLPSTATPPYGALTLAHARNADEVIALGSVADVGGCLAQAGRIMGCTSEEVGQLAKIGKSGVVYVPYLSGRRCPPAKAHGAWLRLRGDDGRAEMARAVVEGVVYALFDAGGGLGVDDVAVVGGMVDCDLFVEGIAALFGGCWRGERDVGVVGAGLVAAEVMGIRTVGKRRGEWVEVDGSVRERWSSGYEEWKSVVGALEGVWDIPY